ncbi:hypothetical protein [Leptospira bouyouniensis]|uniref:hypothetical protein n=1 Tax=Leptospira bouyouniensis TaxID=2484911 RepID=UPI001091348A|nr:hypothetical protein [Leptospira bouyouniensis]TGM79530.1 hypothetical protein EHQ99_07185 [Leptospira bouyouniensis]
MKRIPFVLIFTILLSNLYVFAQVKPQLENEWIVSKSLGPIIDGTSVRWNFSAVIKVDQLKSIRGYELNGKEKKEYFSELQTIKKGNFSIESKALNEEEYSWIFESGLTSKFFTIEVINLKGETNSLNIPINFTEDTKVSLRLFMDKNLGIKKEIVKVPFHRNFDGRKWIIGHSEDNEIMTMLELFPDETKTPVWSELYRFTFLKQIGTSNRQEFINVVKRELTKDCSDLYFNILKETESDIYFEWSHDGCGGYPTGSEISRLASDEEKSYLFTFASNEHKLSKTQKDIYLSILEKEK